MKYLKRFNNYNSINETNDNNYTFEYIEDLYDKDKEFLKILNLFKENDFKIKQYNVNREILILKRFLINHKDENFYITIEVKIKDREFKLNKISMKFSHFNYYKDKFNKYFDYSNKLITEVDVINHLKKTYKLKITENGFIILGDDFQHEFLIIIDYQEYYKIYIQKKIPEFFDFTNNTFLHKFIDKKILTDYHFPASIMFILEDGLTKEYFDRDIKKMIETDNNMFTNLMDNLINDDELFHEVKNSLPNEIINKYLERIDNNDSLL